MADDDTGQPPSVDAVVGRNFRNRRQALDWSQDEMAQVLRKRGLDWSRSTLAAFERGQKEFSLAEFAVLLSVVRATPIQLLQGDEAVALSGDRQIELEDIRNALVGTSEIPSPSGTKAIYRPGEVDLLLQEVEADIRERQRIAARGEVEQKAARKLRIPVDVLVGLAFARWDRSLTDERNRRVRELHRASPSEKSLRARRADATRLLLSELADDIGDYKSEQFYGNED